MYIRRNYAALVSVFKVYNSSNRLCSALEGILQTNRSVHAFDGKNYDSHCI